MFHAKILCQYLRHSSFRNPQISLWFSHCQSLIFVDCSCYTFNILRCSACCRPSRMWITSNSFSTIFEAFVPVPHFYLCFTPCITPESLLNYLNSLQGGIFKEDHLKRLLKIQIPVPYFNFTRITGPRTLTRYAF